MTLIDFIGIAIICVIIYAFGYAIDDAVKQTDKKNTMSTCRWNVNSIGKW